MEGSLTNLDRPGERPKVLQVPEAGVGPRGV